MSTQKIRELARLLGEEATTQKGKILRDDLDSKIEKFILEEIEDCASRTLRLTEEVHTYGFNYFHPDVVKKFPEKLNEGEKANE